MEYQADRVNSSGGVFEASDSSRTRRDDDSRGGGDDGWSRSQSSAPARRHCVAECRGVSSDWEFVVCLLPVAQWAPFGHRPVSISTNSTNPIFVSTDARRVDRFVRVVRILACYPVRCHQPFPLLEKTARLRQHREQLLKNRQFLHRRFDRHPKAILISLVARCHRPELDQILNRHVECFVAREGWKTRVPQFKGRARGKWTPGRSLHPTTMAWSLDDCAPMRETCASI